MTSEYDANLAMQNAFNRAVDHMLRGEQRAARLAMEAVEKHRADMLYDRALRVERNALKLPA
jgi:hypothetical protein